MTSCVSSSVASCRRCRWNVVVRRPVTQWVTSLTDDLAQSPSSSIRLDHWRFRLGAGMVGQAHNQTDHGGGTPVLDRDLLKRTSWVNASLACAQIRKGKANGNVRALWLRGCMQKYLLKVGCFIQRHCGKVVFLGLLLLSLCCVGLKTATLETKMEDLWVEEGGRLSRELNYVVSSLGEGSGTTSELVLQLPKVSGSNVLTVESLLLHLDAVKAATKVAVDMFDITWTFKDVCHAISFPKFGDNSIFDRILENLEACLIITPLDCFWEGSKLLGPDYGVYIPGHGNDVKWTSLNPKEIIQSLQRIGVSFPLEDIEDVLNRSGIRTAYQEKPCLNPHDPDCPETAPNFKTKQIPNIGAVVTGGCSGFATKFMHWEENLILGGTYKNRSGIITRAEAMLSIVQLMGEHDLYEYYRDDYKVHGTSWNQNKSRQILEAWQRAFIQEVRKAVQTQIKVQEYNVYSFSSTNLVDLLEHFSQPSILRVVLGYVFMLIYACLALMELNDVIQSQAGVGVAGVLLVALSIAAGLGICSVIGIKFNASTTQIVPFLAMGLGINDIFLIAHTYSQLSHAGIAYLEQTGECLKRIGVTVLLTCFGNSSAFFMAAIIPIPAMRAFCLQCGILMLFNLASVLLVFPAVVSLDLLRRIEQRVDVFCCFKRFSLMNESSVALPDISRSLPSYSRSQCYENRQSRSLHHTVTLTELDGSHPVTTLATDDASRLTSRMIDLVSLPQSATSSSQCLAPTDMDSCLLSCRQRVFKWSLSHFARETYGPFLERTPVKVVVICAFLVCMIAGMIGIIRIKDGLDLTDVVPRFTEEYNFLEAQSKYFGFYNFFAVTQNNFDYSSATNQLLLYSYHQAFQQVDKIIKSESGSLPDFWLQMFRSWLLDIQQSFDRDIADGCIVADGYLPNATSSGRLGYKLIVQTGSIDEPIDKKRVYHGRLVDQKGIIYPPAFYTYLTAWTSNDALAYSSSQASLRPKPREWIHDDNDANVQIPRSPPLTFAQLAFYMHNLGDTDSITASIKEIRNICDLFSAKGLPNFPSGIIFSFWEQYINLRFFLMLAVIAVLVAEFVVITVVLLNPWAAIIVVVVMATVVVELFGFMGLVSIKLSAIPAVILILTIGISFQFTIHITIGFLTSIGSRNRRMVMALEYFFSPIFHGAVSTLLGIIMLSGSEFEFIFKYFFVVLSVLVILGLINGVVFIPVLLSVIGPNAEVIPANNAEQLQPPSPKPPAKPRGETRSRSLNSSRRVLQRMPPVDQALSTITEESSQYSSSTVSVAVLPEVVVETSVPGNNAPPITTTTASGVGSGRDGRDVCTRPGHCCSCSRTTKSSSRPSAESSHPSSQQVTKIVATARVKVEVHTPGAGVTNYMPEYKSKKRKRRDLPNTTVITGFDSSSSES